MHSRTLRSIAAAVGASCVLGVLTPLASAHVGEVSTGPRNGSRVVRSPASAFILFGGVIRSGTLTVTGPGGVKVSVGSGGRDPRNVDRLLVALKPGLKVGKYVARGATIAADGHHQTWTFTFTVRG